MTKWLMIILALLDSILWSYSVAQHICDNNTQYEGSLWYSKIFHQHLFNGSRPTPFMISSNKTNQNGKILRVALNKFTPEPQAIEKCSQNRSYCVNIDNYPSQELSQIIGNGKFVSPNQDHVDYAETVLSLNRNIDKRSRLIDDLRPACESKEQLIYPEAGLTKNNEWLYIIQINKNKNSGIKQGIIVETCSHRSGEINANCKYSDYLPEGVSSSCVQKYIYKKLMTVDNSKELFYEQFLFPSCCACMYYEHSA